MLDKDILSQLSQLKTDIQASKEYASGTVAGTNGRFGFVRLEDGRDAFLSPEKMLHVIPGDKVKVSVMMNSKNQLEASLEELAAPSLDRFLGQYKTSKKGHFVVPLGSAVGIKSSPINRWIFLPPKSRGRCGDGDMVVARLLQHPFKDGKTSAKILERIGKDTDPTIERRYVCAKYDLVPRYNESALNQTKSIERLFKDQQFGENREDLTHIPFVTIDATSTRDMDDAIALEVLPDGKRRLHVAIADPGSFIDAYSALAYSAQKKPQSLYLLGGAIPMLPESLTNECFSLKAAEVKPALVCSMTLATEGDVEAFEFKKATIKSLHKLSYNGVTAILTGEAHEEKNSLTDDISEMLNSLFDVAQKRFNYRKTHFLVGDDQTEYDIQLSNEGKINAIHSRQKTKAHQIVEEAMLATNLCAGEFLANSGSGFFSSHSGFREDRLGEVKALLKEEGIDHEEDLLKAEHYKNLLRKLQASEKSFLISPLRRMMPSSELSLTPAPHLGMGIPHYATITSPIRRFADLYNHWALNAQLQEQTFKPCSQEKLETIKAALQEGRQADRELYQWLICQYTHTKLIGHTGKAKIRIVTQQGFGARLLDSGIDGFILFPKKQEKTFDAKRMTLTVGEKTYALEQEVEIKVESVDLEKRRISYSLPD